MNKQGYYYLHTNGDLIFKSGVAYNDADFVDSDFVKAYWFIDSTNREDAWTVLVEALALGANKARVKELAEKWHCDDDDARIFAERVNVHVDVDGDKWMVTFRNFINLAESHAGFGDTILEAMADLARHYPINRSGPWSKMSFKGIAFLNS